MNRRSIKHHDTNPNLIPVMDVTFLFIFFLLMSAQFLEVSQIASDAPTIKTTDSKNEDKPLNLTLVIGKQGLSLQKGLDGSVIKTIGRSKDFSELNELHAALLQVKNTSPNERTIIVRPESDVPYEDVIHILDSVREVKPQGAKLFDQVVFET